MKLTIGKRSRVGLLSVAITAGPGRFAFHRMDSISSNVERPGRNAHARADAAAKIKRSCSTTMACCLQHVLTTDDGEAADQAPVRTGQAAARRAVCKIRNRHRQRRRAPTLSRMARQRTGC